MHTLSRGPTQDTHTHPFRNKIDVQPKPSANSGFVVFVCCSVADTHRCFSVDVFCFNVRIFMSILFMYIFGFEAEYDFVCVIFCIHLNMHGQSKMTDSEAEFSGRGVNILLANYYCMYASSSSKHRRNNSKLRIPILLECQSGYTQLYS